MLSLIRQLQEKRLESQHHNRPHNWAETLLQPSMNLRIWLTKDILTCVSATSPRQCLTGCEDLALFLVLYLAQSQSTVLDDGLMATWPNM